MPEPVAGYDRAPAPLPREQRNHIEARRKELLVRKADIPVSLDLRNFKAKPISYSCCLRLSPYKTCARTAAEAGER